MERKEILRPFGGYDVGLAGQVTNMQRQTVSIAQPLIKRPLIVMRRDPLPRPAVAAASKASDQPPPKKETEGKVVLTAFGEVAGGFSDFKPGDKIITLHHPHAHHTANNINNNNPSAAIADTKYVVLDDWRPLTAVVPGWASLLGTSPSLKSVYVLDCGAGGDCLFHVVANGYNHLFQNPFLFKMEGVRELAAFQLGRLPEALAREFVVDLFGKVPSLEPISSLVQRLQTVIRRPGNEYWGETGTLRQLLMNSPPFADFKIGFAVLYMRDKPIAWRPITDKERAYYTKRGKPAPARIPVKWEPHAETHVIQRKDTELLMFLHCLNDTHWVLVGYAPNTVIASTFPITSYPMPLYPFLQEKSK